jgi:hypothetical protein
MIAVVWALIFRGSQIQLRPLTYIGLVSKTLIPQFVHCKS